MQPAPTGDRSPYGRLIAIIAVLALMLGGAALLGGMAPGQPVSAQASCATPPTAPPFPPAPLAGAGPNVAGAEACTVVPVGQPVGFSASATSAPGTTVVGFSFDFGDGSTAVFVGPTPSNPAAQQATASVTHTYTTPGAFTIKVTVTDSVNGATTADVLGIGVTAAATGAGTATGTPAAFVGCLPVAPPTTPLLGCTINTNCLSASGAKLTIPAAGAGPSVSAGGPYTTTIGQPVLFLGSAIPATGSAITQCSWSFGDHASAPYLTPSHTYTVAGSYTATLTVVDTAGNSTSATATVTVAPILPLCQEPSITTIAGAVPCLAGQTCLSSSINLNCQAICPLTGELLAPNQCPGPLNANQLAIANGPFKLQVDQAFTVQTNTNLPAASSLLQGDSITFDFGDHTVFTNNAPQGVQFGAASASGGGATGLTQCADGTVSSTGACTGHGGAISPGSSANICTACFPALGYASHSYSQVGTYTIMVTITFSDGTKAVAQTTATVTGGASGALPVFASPVVPTVSVALQNGCNAVTLTFPNGTLASAVAQAVQGATLNSIYEEPANAPELAYFPDPTAPSNLASVRNGDAATICVTGSGTLVQPAQ